jgi:hypothetical protein
MVLWTDIIYDNECVSSPDPLLLATMTHARASRVRGGDPCSRYNNFNYMNKLSHLFTLVQKLLGDFERD